jgi:hypothetical protein
VKQKLSDIIILVSLLLLRHNLVWYFAVKVRFVNRTASQISGQTGS